MVEARQGQRAAEVERVETLSDGWYRLDRVTFGYTRWHGSRRTLA